ncbi:ENR1 protein, partial [Cisticola juncidis]|nr:ENR1 protein [Cisticola juncidis]
QKGEPDDEIQGKNLFIDLMERISNELNVTDCWVCGSTQMADMWPWEGTSLSVIDILRWKQLKEEPNRKIKRENGKWELKSKVVGEECIKRIG